jgi:twinkle protein
MDEYFRWKKGDITLVTGYGNSGKTTFALQFMLVKSIWSGWKWAIFSPENFPANDFYDDLIEMYAGKWIGQMTEDEYVAAARFINDHIFFVYPDNDHDLASINEKFRYLILKKGVDGVMIDPWNQLDKTQKAYERDDQYLSVALKDVKRFALLNHICYIIVAHPKNPQYNSDRSLPVADMYDLHGGSMWGNKADQIISYYRPRYHEDKNSPEVDVHIQKLKRKRTGGKLGYFSMYLDWKRKRYADPITGEMPCDPERAKKEKLRLENNYTQPQLQGPKPGEGNWRPFDGDTEIGF